MSPTRSASGQRQSDTATRLIEAATAEFNEHGFSGTDSNKIARRAGFSPQTFYRWFKDKSDVFIAVYRDWQEQERRAIEPLIAAGASTGKIVDAIIKQHSAHRVFRRSLRHMSLEDAGIRQARADSRLRQTEQLMSWKGLPASRRQAVFILLLQLERLADAAAEGELEDAGLTTSGLKTAMVRLLDTLT